MKNCKYIILLNFLYLVNIQAQPNHEYEAMVLDKLSGGDIAEVGSAGRLVEATDTDSLEIRRAMYALLDDPRIGGRLPDGPSDVGFAPPRMVAARALAHLLELDIPQDVDLTGDEGVSISRAVKEAVDANPEVLNDLDVKLNEQRNVALHDESEQLNEEADISSDPVPVSPTQQIDGGPQSQGGPSSEPVAAQKEVRKMESEQVNTAEENTEAAEKNWSVGWFWICGTGIAIILVLGVRLMGKSS